MPNKLRFLAKLFLILIPCLFCLSTNRAANQTTQFQDPPDLSGLSWVEGDTFLAVHDAKNPDENDRPRMSLLQLPKSLEGVIRTHITLNWPPPLGLSSDLESIARIPGTNSFLLVESGEEADVETRFRRVFLVRLADSKIKLLSFTDLPDTFKNIEGSAVARISNRLIFICAERADDQSRSEVYWADMELNPLRFGRFNKTYFSPVGFIGRNKRPISAIEIDGHGQLYIASTYDPNDDNGPFTSVIWRAGRLRSDRHNRFSLVFEVKPRRLATLDGFKVESLAIRERDQQSVELFAGTDDENFGGDIRPIPLRLP
jgi:hypothetical protein